MSFGVIVNALFGFNVHTWNPKAFGFLPTVEVRNGFSIPLTTSSYSQEGSAILCRPLSRPLPYIL